MNRLFFVFISFVAMLLLSLPRAKWYNLSTSDAVAVTVYSFVTGIIGTMILFYIENGVWGGTSFYGAVFSMPIFLYVASVCFKKSVGTLTDFMAPSGLAMYGVNKINCLVAGCCGGKIIGYTVDGIPQYFPSQILELIAVIAIIGFGLILEKKDCFRSLVYPICLVIYGIARYALNSYRMEQSNFWLGMSPGNFWSLCAVVIGVIWIFLNLINREMGARHVQR